MTQMKAFVDQLLTGVLQEYRPTGFIADLLFPEVQHAQYSGKLGKLTNSHLRIQNTIMGGKNAARRIDVIRREADGFEIESHGLEGLVTPRDIANFTDPFDAEKEETMALALAIKIGKEKSIADTLTDVAVITQNTTLSGEGQWSDLLNSNPLGNFREARETVRKAVGMKPNVAIMNDSVAEWLRIHPQILEFVRGKVQPGAELLDAELAKALGVERVLIGSALYNEAAEGQTDSLEDIWPNDLIFGVLPPKAEVGQVSGGYQVRKIGSSPQQVFKWDVNNPPNSKAILVHDEYDMLLTKKDAFYLFKSAVATS